MFDKVAPEQVSSEYFDFPCQSSFHQNAPYSSIIRGWYNRPISDRCTKWTQSHLNPQNFKKVLRFIFGDSYYSHCHSHHILSAQLPHLCTQETFIIHALIPNRWNMTTCSQPSSEAASNISSAILITSLNLKVTFFSATQTLNGAQMISVG
jgi:hypothetical protein